jgi:predicted MFS family arabinose efflux permease
MYTNMLSIHLIIRHFDVDTTLALRFIEGAFTVMAFSLIMTSVLDLIKKTQYSKGMGILGLGMALGNATGAPFGGKIGSIDPLYPLYYYCLDH